RTRPRDRDTEGAARATGVVEATGQDTTPGYGPAGDLQTGRSEVPVNSEKTAFHNRRVTCQSYHRPHAVPTAAADHVKTVHNFSSSGKIDCPTRQLDSRGVNRARAGQRCPGRYDHIV